MTPPLGAPVAPVEDEPQQGEETLAERAARAAAARAAAAQGGSLAERAARAAAARAATSRIGSVPASTPVTPTEDVAPEDEPKPKSPRRLAGTRSLTDIQPPSPEQSLTPAPTVPLKKSVVPEEGFRQLAKSGIRDTLDQITPQTVVFDPAMQRPRATQANDTVRLGPKAITPPEKPSTLPKGEAWQETVANSPDLVLAHEYGHGLNEDYFASKNADPKLAAAWQSVLRGQVKPGEYGYMDPKERFAEAFTNGVKFLREAKTPEQAQELASQYEARVPGTSAMVSYLLSRPIYANHPARALTAGALATAEKVQRQFGDKPMTVATTPAEGADALRLRTDKGSMRIEKVAQRGDSTDVRILDEHQPLVGEKDGVLTVPTAAIQEPMKEAHVAVGRPIAGIERQVGNMSQPELQRLANDPALSTRIATRLAMLRAPAGKTVTGPKLSVEELFGHVVMNGLASSIPGIPDDQDTGEKMEQFAKEGGKLQPWQINLLAGLHAGAAVMGARMMGKALGAGSEIGQTTGAEAAGARLGMAGSTQPMRAGAEKAIADIARENEVQPSVVAKVLSDTKAALAARAPQLAEAGRQGAIQATAGAAMTGAGAAASGERDPKEIVKAMGKAALVYGGMGTAFSALSAEDQFNAGYKIMKAGLDKAKLSDRLAAEKMARTPGEPGEEFGASGLPVSNRPPRPSGGSGGAAKPAGALPAGAPRQPAAPGTPLEPDLEKLATYAVDALTPGTHNPVDVENANAYIQKLPPEQRAAVQTRIQQLAAARGPGESTDPIVRAQEAPAPVPQGHAADLPSEDVRVIVKANDLGDVAKQAAATHDVDTETAQRMVVEKYRDLVHGGMPRETAQAEVAKAFGPAVATKDALETASKAMFDRAKAEGHDDTGDDGLGVCTNCAQHIVDKFGGQVVGYAKEDNPTAKLAGIDYGHDFAVIKGRYLVDPWAQHTAEVSTQSAYDLHDPKDLAKVRTLYGDPKKWNELTKDDERIHGAKPLDLIRNRIAEQPVDETPKANGAKQLAKPSKGARETSQNPKAKEPLTREGTLGLHIQEHGGRFSFAGSIPAALADQHGHSKTFFNEHDALAAVNQYRVDRATELGKAAFDRGSKAIPALDKDLEKVGGKAGSPEWKAAVDAWLKAWHKANLAAPMPESPVEQPTPAARNRFAIEYEKELRAALAKDPTNFAYGPDQVPGVVEKMVKAIAAKNANISSSKALKRVAKTLGVKFNMAEMSKAAAAPPEASPPKMARTEGGRLRDNLGATHTDELLKELTKLYAANNEDGSVAVPSIIPDEHGSHPEGKPYVGMKGQAVNASGRIAARKKSIDKIEAELKARGIPESTILDRLGKTSDEDVERMGIPDEHEATSPESVDYLQFPPKPKQLRKAAAAKPVTTEFDTPAVVEARQWTLDHEPTFTIDTPEQNALREQVAKFLYGDGAKRKEKQFTYWIGLPASGKSGMAEADAERNGALLLDTDFGKPKLRGYEGGKGTSVVHVEASRIRNVARDRALAAGDNIVLPTVGHDLKGLTREIDALSAAGWTVHVRFADLPAALAAPRAVRRYAEGGIFVDPAYILSISELPSATYEALKNNPAVTTYERYDTDTPRGTPARLIESGRGGAGRGVGSPDRGSGEPGVGGRHGAHAETAAPAEAEGVANGTRQLRRGLPGESQGEPARDVSVDAGGRNARVLGGRGERAGNGAVSGAAEETGSAAPGAQGHALPPEGATDAGAGPAGAGAGAERGHGAPSGRRLGRESRGSVHDREPGTTQPVALPKSEQKPAAQTEPAEKPAVVLGEQPAAENYVIDGDLGLSRGAVARAKDNLTAIRLMKSIEADGRIPTRAEQATLAKYVGWGGIAGYLDKGHKLYESELGREIRDELTPEEFRAAAASTPNAHYTSLDVVKATHLLLNHLGFAGGHILEPSMGAGIFLGATPPQNAHAYKWTGVELDSITGRIAKLLYPKADVRVQGFEKVHLPDGYFDAAIGNVPFGDYPLHDPRYNKLKLSIHDYFFAKSLDLVRPGGVVAYITSRYTMDRKDSSFRQYLGDRADLLGAIRLPNTAFKGNAGTDVVTDLIVLRRRAEGQGRGGHPFTALQAIETPDGAASVNEYFARHSDRMLGTPSLGGTMYGGKEFTLEPFADTPLADSMRAAINGFPRDYTPRPIESPASRSREDLPGVEPIAAPDDMQDGVFVIRDGVLKQKQGHELVDAKVPAAQHAKVMALTRIKDAVKALLNAEVQNEPDESLDLKREYVNTLYDRFVRDLGPINLEQRTETKRLDKEGNPIVSFRYPNLTAFTDDPEFPWVTMIEEYDAETNTAKKADMLTRRVMQPRKAPERVDTPSEAVPIVLAEQGKIDVARIAQLAGTSEAEVTKALGGSIIFKNPATDAWEPADFYLSGDVKSKLAAARVAAEKNPDLKANVAALEKAIPKDLKPSEIGVNLGAVWVPTTDIERFIGELLAGGPRDVRVSHSHFDSTWTVTERGHISGTFEATSKYGTLRKNGLDLIRDALNLKETQVYDRDPLDDKKRVKNVDETLAAQEKQQQIKDEFKRWIWSDGERAERLAALYNEKFNRMRLPNPDGSHLTLPGAASHIKGQPFQLRPHQLNAIWRILAYGNTLLAHVVGSGKTYTMVAAGMEAKRLGLARKILYPVPNHMLAQFRDEFKSLYPMAKLLVATKDDFAGDARREFIGRAAAHDWDAIIMTHRSFESVPMSAEFQREHIERELNDLETAIREAKAAKSDRALIKQIEKSKKRREAKLEKLLAAEKKDRFLSFEQMGVDMMFVDEAHYGKNLEFTTKMQGVSSPASERAFDLFLKTQYLHRVNPGRGVVFATGTPISNALAEMYTLQRYLQPELLKERGVDSFDAWAATFAEPVTKLEIAPDGSGARIKTRLAKYNNLGELAQMFRMVTDVQSKEDLNLPTPDLSTGKMQVVSAKATPALKAFVQSLVRRAKLVKEKKVDPSEDNFLRITTHGRNAALDMRLVDPDAGNDPNSKLNQAVDKIAEVYKRTAALKGVQLVFSDLSTPGSDPSQSLGGVAGWNAYQHVKESLVAKGVNPKEIRFMHDATSDEKKRKLFADARAGRVRILLGSTEKMGAGTNVQDRLVALHHLDAPWRPSDVEQRNGRILRQGNILFNTGKIPHVEIYAYVTEGSFDAYIWQTLERKADFISQALKAGPGMRTLDDEGDVQVDFATAKAIASGNPKVMEKAQVDSDIARLERLERAHQDQMVDAQRELRTLPAQIAELEGKLAKAQADADHIVDTSGKNFSITVKDATTDKRKDAGLMLEAAVMKNEHAATKDKGNDVVARIGQFAGFKLAVVSRQSAATGLITNWLALEGADSYFAELDSMASPTSMQSALEHLPAHIRSLATELEGKLGRRQTKLDALKDRGIKPFEHADKLKELKTRQAALDKELQADAERAEKEANQTPEARDEELRRKLAEDSGEGDIVSGARTTEGRAGMDVNRQGLADTMSANVYQGGLPKIIVKEAIQNAIDAIRPHGKGTVTIDLDSNTRRITVSDDGVGMSPQTATGPFLDAFSSEKPEGASGGLGIAKAALFRYGAPFRMETVAELPGEPVGGFRLLRRATPTRKVRTTIEGTGQDWIDGALTVHEEEVDATTPTGTTLAVTIDKAIEDDSTFYAAKRFVEELQRNSRLPGITFKGVRKDKWAPDDIGGIESKIPPKPRLTAPIPGGRADVFTSDKPMPYSMGGTYTTAHILNNGYHQFDLTVPFGPNAPELWIDVHADVPVSDPSYPFTIDRGKLKDAAEKAIKESFKSLASAAEAEHLDILIRSLASAPEIRGGGRVYATAGVVTKEMTDRIAARPYASALAAWWRDAGRGIVEAVAVRHDLEAPTFDGIGLGGDYLAVNVMRKGLFERAKELGVNVGSDASNLLLFNPFNVILEARAQKAEFASDPEHLADQLWGALVHEIAHQNARGHDEKFAGEFTRIDGRAARVQSAHLPGLEELWRTLLADNDFLADVDALKAMWQSKADTFKGFIGHANLDTQRPTVSGSHLGGADAGGAVLTPARRLGGGEVSRASGRAAVRPGSDGRSSEPSTDRADVRGTDEGGRGNDSDGVTVGDLTDLHSFVDPISAAIKMWKQANAYRAARLRQTNAIRAVTVKPARQLGAVEAAKQTIQQVADKVRAERDAILALLAPSHMTGESAQAGRILNAKLGDKALNDIRAREALLDMHTTLGRMPKADAYAFVDRVERGQPQPTPALQAMANLARRMLDERRDTIRGFGKGALKTFRKNYWPRIVVDQRAPAGQSSAMRATTTRRPFQGGKSFLKKRTFDYLSDAVAAGYEPITSNPADWLLLKVREMNRYIAAHEWANEARAEGLIKFYRPSKKLPEGWSWLDDSMFTVYAPRGGEGEMRVRGKYAAPAPVARIVNNYLSAGLRGNPIYDSYMFLGNSLNMVQLAISAFHLGFVSFDATVSQGSLGFEQLLTPGARAKGAGNLAMATASMALGPLTVIPVVSPAISYLRGRELRKAYIGGTTSLKLERMVKAVAEGGGRVEMDDLYKSDAVTKFRQALKDKRWIGTAFQLPFAALELSMKPILEHIVPRLKLGAYYALAEQELSKLPTGASEDDIRRVLQNAWEAIDDRLGQVVYDNYHWHNVTKQTLMGTIRAVGWHRGGVSIVVGGAASTVTSPVRLGRKLARGGGGSGGGGGSTGSGGPAWVPDPAGGGKGHWEQGPDEAIVTHRMAYFAMLVALMAVYGSVYTYLHTGERPGSHDGEERGTAFLLKDMYLPRTGEVNRDGNPERINPASYIKDMISLGRHPVTAVTHWMQPALAMLNEIVLTNQNFFGDEIRNPDDPAGVQARQIATQIIDESKPFSVQNMQQAAKRGAPTRAKVEGFVGNVAAPRDLVKTKAQNMMDDILRRRGHPERTPEEVATTDTRKSIKLDAQLGEVDRDSIRQLVRNHVLTPRQAEPLALAARAKEPSAPERVKNAANPLVAKFKQLGPEDARRVFDAGEPWEQRLWGPWLKSKERRFHRSSGGTP